MPKQNDRLFSRPHVLEWATTILKIEEKGGLVMLQPAESNAEAENPEGGDQGIIHWRGGEMSFTKVESGRDRALWYHGGYAGALPSAGEPIVINIDAARRRHHAGYHSFSHLLTALYRRSWRDEIIATSAVFADHGELRIKGEGVRVAEANDLWNAALAYLGKNDTVEQSVMPRVEALALAGSHFEAVLPKFVRELRVVRVGHDLPWIPCRGVHLANLEQLSAAFMIAPVSTDAGDLVFSYSLEIK